MDAPPLALLRLRESEIVRLCGLMRAARGQEAARQGKITQAERVAGTLRATMLEGETSRVVAAHFSDAGMEGWECSCPVFAEQRAARDAESPVGASLAALPQESTQSPLPSFACEHVAALLSAWLLNPRQFQTEGGKPAPAIPAATSVPQRTAPPQATRPTLSPALEQQRPAPAALESLGSAARRLLGLLALAGGSASDDEAQRLFARMDLGPIEAAPQILRHLHEAGWLEPLQSGSRGRSRPLAEAPPPGWAIPAALLAQVPREVTLEEMPAVDALTLAPADAFHLPEQLVLALALVLAQPPSNDRARMLQEQPGISAEQARFLLALLYQAGLISGEQANLKSPELAPARAKESSINSAAAGETLLRGTRFLLWRDTQEVAHDLLTLWRYAHLTGELADLREVGVRVAVSSQRERRKISADIVAENRAAKAFVLDLLGAVPAGRWWGFGSWVEFIWRFRPGFLRGRQEERLRPEWWLERMEDGEVLSPEVRAEWRQGEGRYLALLVRRGLHWLGLLDLAFDARGRLQAFRVTPAGARLLQKAATAVDEQPGDEQPGTADEVPSAAPTMPIPPENAQRPLPLQAVRDDRLFVPIAALREADPAALERLLCWCEPAGATADGLLVQPTARRVAAGLDAGGDLEAWLATLEASKPLETPALQSLIARVRGWAAAYGRVRLYPLVALLEVADATLMRELERVVNLAERRDHTLSPELAVIRPAEVEPLLEELRRRGYAPWCSIP